jgi:hypothetical protein
MKPKIKSMDLEKLLGKRFVSEKHQVDFIIRIAKQPYTFEGLQEIRVSSNNVDFYNLSDGIIK